ncbi:kinase-like domain-containing protein [Peziza echinospora]|nr:kinase-like domain-containing protein [Peziza echinospora]
MADNWKFMISFSDRFAVINELAEALKERHGTAHREAIATAQALDLDCLGRASSLEEYNRLWREELAGITASRKADAAQLSNKEPSYSRPLELEDLFSSSNSGKPSFGPYIHPIYHTTGVTSVVYKATLPPDHHSFSNPGNFPTPPGLVVALKTTCPSSLHPPHSSYAEAKILEAVLPHPHIIPLLETFTSPGAYGGLTQFVLVFPFCPSTLSTVIPRPTQKFCFHILKGTISALAHLHKHGIIHRDIKPSNILLYPSQTPDSLNDGAYPHVYLADFGISWSAATHASSLRAVEPAERKITDVGTTHYRAIELLFGYTAYGVEVDLWALGCVVAECFLNLDRPSSSEWKSLFEAGDLGSELRLIASIFQTMGTPTEESWPGSDKLPDFGKIQFRDFPRRRWEDVVPQAPEAAIRLIDSLVRFEGSERISAEEALKDPMFNEV